jgi:Pentapeptide repeats (8 copies)
MKQQRFIETTKSIVDSKSRKFTTLAALAGLDPQKDFVFADMRNTDLRNEDLRGFDLTGADLRGAILTNCKLPETALRTGTIIEIPAFRNAPNSLTDRKVRELVQMSLFGERYYKRIAHLAALAMLVWDRKFLAQLSKYIERDKSVYMQGFYDSLLHKSGSIRDRSERNIAIARSLRKYRYPLDGQRFDIEIDAILIRFPELRSYIRPRYTT